MTAVEKVLARASGVASVAPWDVFYPQPELVFVHDLHIEGCKRALDELGITRIKNPERVVFVTDHEVSYLTPRAAERGANIRKAAREWGVGRFYDVGRGGHGHIFPMEMGLVRPGMCVLASDMHCSNFGAIGAVPVRAGSEGAVILLAMGVLWTTIPPSVKIRLNGKLNPGVYGRDIGFKLAWELVKGPRALDIDYRYLELSGSAISEFNVNDLVALCNTPTEMGAAGVFIPPSERTLTWCRSRSEVVIEPVYSDPDAAYEATLDLNVSGLQPQIALPGNPSNAVDIGQVGSRKVDHAYVGSCGSGMYEDFVVAASILKGRTVAAGTRLFVVPGTVQTAQRLTDEGVMRVFHDAGAVVLPPGCGPCAGGNMALMHSGEVSISSAATNGAGRMGAKDSECYLGSPATVAASAVTGKITHPCEFLESAHEHA